MNATTEFKINHSKVQLERCESAYAMFVRKFNSGDKTFTEQKQSEILASWANAILEHTNEIKKLALL